MAHDQEIRCYMLELPGELRNRIWEYVVAGTSVLTRDSGKFDFPAVIYVNQQVRRETLSIYLCEHVWNFYIQDFDGAFMERAIASLACFLNNIISNSTISSKLLEPSPLRLPIGARIFCFCHGGASWSNLEAWLKEYHRLKHRKPARSPPVHMTGRVFNAAFTITTKMLDLAWADVAAALEALHSVAAAADPAWA